MPGRLWGAGRLANPNAGSELLHFTSIQVVLRETLTQEQRAFLDRHLSVETHIRLVPQYPPRSTAGSISRERLLELPAIASSKRLEQGLKGARVVLAAVQSGARSGRCMRPRRRRRRRRRGTGGKAAHRGNPPSSPSSAG
eukprot:1195556-Prorocentrum_minimum.AAC.5